MDKVCSKCGGPGPFPKVGKQCKKCIAAQRAVYFQKKKAAQPPKPPIGQKASQKQYRETHKAQIAARKARQWRRDYGYPEPEPQPPSPRRDYQRQYRQENAADLGEANRKWRQQNRERANARQRLWRQRRKERQS